MKTTPESGGAPLEDLLAQSAWLRRLAGTLVAGEAAAEDLVQETWLAALRHPPADGDPRPWLARVARNLASNFRRGEARRRTREASELEREPGDDAELDPARLTEAVDAQRALAEAVLHLPEPLRATVVLRHFRGLDSAAIARQQGVPDGTVRWRLKRALELLRVDLDRRFGERERWCRAFAVLLPAAPFGPTAAAPSSPTGVTLMSTTMKLVWGSALLVTGLATWWWLDDATSAPGPELARRAPAAPDAPASAGPEAPRAEAAPAEPAAARAELAGSAAPREPEVRECCVVGRVLDDDGRGIAGARVVARAAELGEQTLVDQLRDHARPPETASDADGLYELALPTQRPFVLTASHPAFAPLASEPVFAGERRDLVLLPGATLSVRVSEADGRVASGARVRASLRAPDSYTDLWTADGVADESGALLFHGVPAGKVGIEGALAEARGEHALTSDGRGAATCELVLRATARVEGVVLERGSHAPIAGARVERERSYAGLAPALTDEAGRFTLSGWTFGDGLSALEAHAAGFAPGFQMLRVPEGSAPRPLRFELVPAVSAHGVVLDAARRPIAGLRLLFLTHVLVPPMTAAGDRREVHTDALGRFEVGELVPGALYRLLVDEAGELRGTFVLRIPGDSRVPVDVGELVLGELAALRGEVVEASPESAYLVHLFCLGDEPWSGEQPNTKLATTRTDAHGRFAFDALAPGRYHLALFAQRKEGEREERVNLPLMETEFELAPGERREDVRLDPRAPSVSGSVLGGEGRPQQNATLRLFTLEGPPRLVVTGASDSRGRFRLHPTTPGPFRLEVEDLALQSAAQTLAPVALGDDLSIALAPFASEFSIRGRLTREDLAPVEELFVRFIDARSGVPLHRVAIPELDGRFVMQNLRDVPYDLELLDFDGRYEPVTLAEVRPGVTELELVLTPRP